MAECRSDSYLLLQSDWAEILRNRDGKAWITCKLNYEQPGIHGELKSSGMSGLNGLSVSSGFTLGKVTNDSIELGYSDPNCRCSFITPLDTFTSIHSGGVISMDVTAGNLGVSACSQRKVFIWETTKGVIRRQLEGHVGDVFTCKFFPSGLVILTGGADMRLKIWSAESGQCPVTLTGHTGGISDTAIVGRGRNVISVSRDGSARLWDCGQATCLASLCQLDTFINKCALSDDLQSEFGYQDGNLPVTHSDREINTGGKLLLLACEDNALRAVSVYHRSMVFSFPCSAAVNSCKFVNQIQAVCGCEDGTLRLIDFRNTSGPVHCWLDTKASVISLLSIKNGFLAGKSDGMCVYYELNSDKRIQLSGSDCDAIYDITSDGKFVFSCARDGAIRKYRFT